jgi:HSP20 family protein
MTLVNKLRHMEDFDLLFKNFFNSESFFTPVVDTKIGHPVDIYENKTGLHLEVAGTGLTKSDINISLEGDILRISYEKKDDTETTEERYIYKGISRKSFNLGYRISPKFNLSEAEAEMENGLLHISIPIAEESKPKTLTIK